MGPILAFLAAAVSLQAAPDAREIVRRSLQVDEAAEKIARNYTFLEKTEQREVDDSGRVKSRKSKTYDVTMLEGSPYRRLVERDGRPLPPKDEQKEREKLQNHTTWRHAENEAQRKQRMADYEQSREHQRQIFREVLAAFDFHLLGEERLNSREMYVIGATPHPGYEPHLRATRFFPKVKGKLWIDKEDYQWVKAEAESIDTISIGAIILRVAKGARLTIEMEHVNNEVWLPKHVLAKASARIALVRKFDGEYEVNYSNYRKFQADSHLITTQQGK